MFDIKEKEYQEPGYDDGAYQDKQYPAAKTVRHNFIVECIYYKKREQFVTLLSKQMWIQIDCDLVQPGLRPVQKTWFLCVGNTQRNWNAQCS